MSGAGAPPLVAVDDHLVADGFGFCGQIGQGRTCIRL
jgi:hypothetical protein